MNYTSKKNKINRQKEQKVTECICEFCKNTFFVETRKIRYSNKTNTPRGKFCSQKCFHQSKNGKTEVRCLHCNQSFVKKNSEIARSANHFCSRSCSATYNNTHKTKGTRRSKLEMLIEQSIKSKFPELEFLINDKTTIGSELDIYIPSLKLAFELNGIFHYEPIFGLGKLNKIQINDKNKFQKCQESGISLCIIDTSQHKYITEKTSKKYVDVVLMVLEQHIKLFVHQQRVDDSTLTNVQVV